MSTRSRGVAGMIQRLHITHDTFRPVGWLTWEALKMRSNMAKSARVADGNWKHRKCVSGSSFAAGGRRYVTLSFLDVVEGHSKFRWRKWNWLAFGKFWEVEKSDFWILSPNEGNLVKFRSNFGSRIPCFLSTSGRWYDSQITRVATENFLTVRCNGWQCH